MARKSIDKNTRNNVWRRYWGNSMDGQCWVCGRPIHADENYQCGHIVSATKGGDENILNLIPICIGCNQGMKEENLLDYKKRYYSHIYVRSLVQPESPDIYVKGKEAISHIIRKGKEAISQAITMTARPIDNDIDDQRGDIMTAQPVDVDISEKDKRERYGEYASAIQRMLPDIKKMISSAKSKEIKFRVMDIAKDMGEDFIDKSPTTIYWGLKYVLFKERIVVDLSTRSGEKFLVMRNATSDDKLPPSLAKFLESDGIAKDTSEKTNEIKKKISLGELIDILKDLPSPLGNTLEVYYHTLDGLTRTEATNLVAKRKDVTPSTISSSYTRSLDKSTSEIDILMQSENSNKLKKFLIAQFPKYIDEINEFFDNI